MDRSISIAPIQIFDAQALGVSGASTCSAVSNIQDLAQSSGYYIIQWDMAGPGSVTLTALHSLDDTHFEEVSGVGDMATSITSGIGLKKGDFGIANKVKIKAYNTSASAVTSLDLWFACK